MNQSPVPSSLSLDQWIALNDEMVALIRAGVPLDRALVDFARGWPRRLRGVVEQLTSRLQAGDSLPQALERSGAAFPPLYRAVVEAGLRSGKLAAALEQVSLTAQRAAELRRIVGLSLMYPLFVVALAYAAFCWMVLKVMPVMAQAMQDLTDSTSVIRSVLVWLTDNVAFWAPWFPVVATIGLAIYWWRFRRATWDDDSRRGSARTWYDGWPTPGRLMRRCRQANFAELLALLLDHAVPLPEAVELAAEASGDRGLRTAATTLADQLRRGVTAATSLAAPTGFPPLLGWLILTADRQPRLVESLRDSAETSRQDTLRGARWLGMYLPMILTTVIGGTAVLLFGLAIFAPLIQLLFELGQP